jgi:hypothetical protein
VTERLRLKIDLRGVTDADATALAVLGRMAARGAILLMLPTTLT